MCGIGGVFSQSLNKKSREKAVQNINESQRLRGPDDSGLQSFDNLTFGHRRLSIIDLSEKGHQPMTYKGVSITYNGEIYNFKELKKELKELGYEFNTETDTEVILAGYKEWGIEIIKKLRGMFAFGLWDGDKEKFYLVRDKFGIKPLYYYADDEKLVFASTVKAIEASGLIKNVRNEQAFIGFLLFGSVPLPFTTLKDVYALPPGHYLELSLNGKIKITQYYNPLDYFQSENHPYPESVQDVVKKTRYLLEDSVFCHLVSDAPLGVFLSGGLDSSAVAALAARQNKNQINTLSVVFDEAEFSEEKYSSLVAQKINSRHRKIKITRQDFFDNLAEAFEAMDQPTIDGINTFFISKAAKQAGFKTVLSGLGGDEIFLGYPYFKKAEFIRKIQKYPSFIKLPLKIAGAFGEKTSKLAYLSQNNILAFYLTFRGLFNLSQIQKLLKISKQEIVSFMNQIIDVYNLTNPKLLSLHPVDLLSYLELKFYLQNQLLKDTDFMSMHHSVEVRVPFLDHKLVEYITSLPIDIKVGKEILNLKLKIKNSCPKPLLIAAVQDILPQEVWDRDKMGFTFPFQKWLKESPEFARNQNFTHWSRNWALEVMKRF